MDRIPSRVTFVLAVALLVICTGNASAALTTTNGNFQASNQASVGDGLQNIVGWFDSTPNFSAWEFGRAGSPVNVAGTLSNTGWMYQSLGSYLPALGSQLDWSLDAVNTNINNGAGDPFEIDFFAGAFPGAAENVDIQGQGLFHIGGTTFSDSGNNFIDVVARNGTFDLSGVTAGAEVWLRINGGNFDGVDNIVVQQQLNTVPEPATASLALMGLGGLMMRRRRMA